MKRLSIFFLFFFMSQCMGMDELLQELNEKKQKIETECCKVINDIFMHARISLEAEEEIINPQWLGRKEIKELQNHLSDATIIFSFDANVKNVIPERLEIYLQYKIREEAEILFERNKITAEGIRQFFYLSRMLYGLSNVSQCRDMIRIIKKENETPLLKLKIQEKICRHEKKEEMRELCENIVMGALPRK